MSDLAASDFTALRKQLARTRGPHAPGERDSADSHGVQVGATTRPSSTGRVRFGPEFKRPKPKVFRKARREGGVRLYEPVEVRAMLAVAREPLRTMILLGGATAGWAGRTCPNCRGPRCWRRRTAR